MATANALGLEPAKPYGLLLWIIIKDSIGLRYEKLKFLSYGIHHHKTTSKLGWLFNSIRYILWGDMKLKCHCGVLGEGWGGGHKCVI